MQVKGKIRRSFASEKDESTRSADCKSNLQVSLTPLRPFRVNGDQRNGSDGVSYQSASIISLVVCSGQADGVLSLVVN